jgi:hypothetical protein
VLTMRWDDNPATLSAVIVTLELFIVPGDELLCRFDERRNGGWIISMGLSLPGRGEAFSALTISK